MKTHSISPRFLPVLLFLLCTIVPPFQGNATATGPDAGERIFAADDGYLGILARTVAGNSGNTFGLEIGMTPKPGWKLCSSNPLNIKPLSVKFSSLNCLKPKGVPGYSKPDLSGTDDSGSFTEYYTNTANFRQDFTVLKCAKKNATGVATVTYLLCQDNRCVGPFSREIKFSGPGHK